MMKRILAVFLCGIMLLCFTACNENTNPNSHPTESTNQSETNSTVSVDTKPQPTELATEPTEPPTQPTETPSKPTAPPTEPTEPSEPVPTEITNQTDPGNQVTAFFNTKNIKRITFYAYYGTGKGRDVPAEHLDEIITWLDSFTIGEEAPKLLPPGTNTIHVELEYLDGTITKQGIDTTTMDGVAYYLSKDVFPDCYREIISKTSLN